MIRKQVYIEQRHDRMLKRRAKQRGITEAEVIREALDSVEIGVTYRRQEIDARAARKALAFMRSLAASRRKVPGRRTWTRESLYEDRIGRWVKS
jgi:hypothetical protein